MQLVVDVGNTETVVGVAPRIGATKPSSRAPSSLVTTSVTLILDPRWQPRNFCGGKLNSKALAELLGFTPKCRCPLAVILSYSSMFDINPLDRNLNKMSHALIRLLQYIFLEYASC